VVVAVVYNLSTVASLRTSGSETTEQFGSESLSTASDNVLSSPNPTGEIIPELTPIILELYSPLPTQALPDDYELTDELIHLGRILFYDPRLSANQQTSCNTCHLLTQFGVDHRARSMGHDGDLVPRNSPTVYNAALHFSQFWDGRAPTVEAQAIEPILSSQEMSMETPEYVMQVLGSIPEYIELFTAAYPDQPDPFTLENVAQALGAFERGLLTPSRVDTFIQGDYTQLTLQEQQGMVSFVEVGCARCHSGTTIGGQSYQKLGEIIPYPVEDQGLYEITGREEHRQVFKVPSLRNVARTAPYLHDGSISALEEMVIFMSRHQLGKELNQTQVTDIVTFLEALTGEIPVTYIAEPPLPSSGLTTPGRKGS